MFTLAELKILIEGVRVLEDDCGDSPERTALLEHLYVERDMLDDGSAD